MEPGRDAFSFSLSAFLGLRKELSPWSFCVAAYNYSTSVLDRCAFCKCFEDPCALSCCSHARDNSSSLSAGLSILNVLALQEFLWRVRGWSPFGPFLWLSQCWCTPRTRCWVSFDASVCKGFDGCDYGRAVNALEVFVGTRVLCAVLLILWPFGQRVEAGCSLYHRCTVARHTRTCYTRSSLAVHTTLALSPPLMLAGRVCCVLGLPYPSREPAHVPVTCEEVQTQTPLPSQVFELPPRFPLVPRAFPFAS